MLESLIKMKALILATTLCVGVHVHLNAQDKKNELQIGSPGAYFFDDSPFRWHMINFFPFISHVSYRRLIGQNNVLSLQYCYYALYNREPYGTLEPNEIVNRRFTSLDIIYLYKLRLGNDLSLFPFSGIKYRFHGGELFHESYVIRGPWVEEHFGYRFYHEFGLSAGLSAKYRFWKNFNIGISADYTRYFAEASPYQLTTMVSIGYEF
jgi:hypothetical protein